MTETFIVRNIEQDIIKNNHRSSCKVSVTKKFSNI